jgi:formate dehydrogenase subunit delta
LKVSARELDRLIRMANQIALNLGGRGEAELVAEKIADHLARFWTPAMREQLAGYHRDGGAELAPAVQHALTLICRG